MLLLCPCPRAISELVPMTNSKGSLYTHVVLASNMRAFVLFLHYAWLLWFSQPCFARDTLNAGEKIKGNETILVSAGKQFELGFFSPLGSTGGTGRYLGIWYHRQDDSEPQTVGWVANRDQPVAADSTGVFQIAEDGNLVVVDTSGRSYWSSKLVEDSSSTNRTVKLMDSGNLVLLDDHLGLGMNLWQSFQHPTDTFLPGMKMDKNLELTCWRDLGDPGRGNFTFKMAQTRDDRFVVLNRDQLYWESERQGELSSEATPDDMSIEVSFLLTNFTEPVRKNSRNLNLVRKNSRNLTRMNYFNTRLVINATGVIQFLLRDNFQGQSVRWLQPKTKCWTYNACEKFTSCNDNKKPMCNCLPGFNPIPTRNGHSGDSLQDKGCARKSASCGKDTTFLNLVKMKIGSPDKQVTVENESECRSVCLNMCPQCQACSYTAPTTRRDFSPSTCWIWTQDLVTLQEEYQDGDDGRNLSVRVDKSDIGTSFILVKDVVTLKGKCFTAHIGYQTHKGITTIPYYKSYCFIHYKTGMLAISIRLFLTCVTALALIEAPTPKTCEPCGTNIIPYPLSTGPSCGDPTYLKFSCNSSTGQLSFTTTNDSYRVTGIDKDSRKFFIQVNSLTTLCNRKHLNDEILQISQPFIKNIDCYVDNKVEVIWLPPSEPTCTHSRDCEGWAHSTCKGSRCLCRANYYWRGDLLRCIKEAVSLPNSTLGEPTRKENSKSPLSLILGITLTGVVILACTIIFAYICRRKIAPKQDSESIRRTRGRLYDSERHVKDLIDMEGLEEKDNEGIEVPYFDFESILVATDHFSDANKLGRGGYGPVYKGKLQGGQDIAVKRLSSVSSQGLKEFKNEVVLIAKLQHRNLVRLGLLHKRR